MKGIKQLVAIGIVALFLCSWYMLFNNAETLQNKYDGYLEAARTKATMGITSDATDFYMKAIKMNDSFALRKEIAIYYNESKQYNKYEEWCENIVSLYPKKADGYELLAKFYQESDSYYECFDIIHEAQKRGASSDTLKKIEEDCYYKYELVGTYYEEIKTVSSDLIGVKLEDKGWGYCNTKGNVVISCGLDSVGYFTNSGYAPVRNKEGHVYLIDTDGEKKFVDVENKQIEECYDISEDKMAVKIDGMYCYVDLEFKKLFGDFEYASSFNNGVAAIREGDKWYLINGEGNKITEQAYEDVIIDEKQMAFRNGLAFVKLNGAYQLIDTNAQRVGSGEWEDAQLFLTDAPTCVKVDGKWGFINTSGEQVIEPNYTDAKPFSNGLAAVANYDKWGYVALDSKEIVIPVEYDDAKEFNSSGCTFVKEGEKWKLLKLYRLNKRN